MGRWLSASQAPFSPGSARRVGQGGCGPARTRKSRSGGARGAGGEAPSRASRGPRRRRGSGDPGGLHSVRAAAGGPPPRPSPSSAEIAGRPRLRWRSTVQGVSRGRDRAPRASWGAVPQRCRRGGPGPTWPALGRSVSFLRRGGLVRISNVTTRGSPRAPHFPVSPAGGVVPRAEGEPFGVLRFPMSFCARSGVEFLDDFTHQQLSVRHCVRLVELKVRPSPCLQRAF